MLKMLEAAIQAMPELLKDPEAWNSLKVDYNHPHVDRLWRSFEGSRILLHRIHPCTTEQALLHPHPWPSAVWVLPRVHGGSYETGIGYGDPSGEVPPLAAKFILATGTTYEMTDPNGWHYVRPIKRHIYTMMVTGKPYGLPKDERFGQLKQHRLLTEEERRTLFQAVRPHFGL